MNFQYLCVVMHVLLTTLFYVIDIKKHAPKEVMGQGRESPDSLYDTIDDGVESFQGNLTKTLPRSTPVFNRFLPSGALLSSISLREGVKPAYHEPCTIN